MNEIFPFGSTPEQQFPSLITAVTRPSTSSMDYEALKDQWSDIEERDGIRLSWNTFPSSRMVRAWMYNGCLAVLFTESYFRKHPD